MSVRMLQKNRMWCRLLAQSVILMAAVSTCKSTDFNGDTGRSEPAIPPLQTQTFQQITRAGKQATFTQGKSGATTNEDYNITAFGVLDLLVVIDNSGSMAEEQSNLAARLSPLLSAVQDSDWRIAVTTTDPSDRCVTDLIKKNDSNAASRFAAAINAGTSGDGIERPILRAVQGLKSECFWGPGKWLRDGSTVAVLIVTDEDNCHIDVARGYGCSSQADKDGAYLTNYLASIRKVGSDARVYGIIRHPSQSPSQCPTALKSADIVSSVIAQSGGTWGSICDADYGATLSKISSDVAKILKTDFVLKGNPDPGTLAITVNGQPWTAYTLNGLVVHFTAPPPAGAPVRVAYRSGAAGVVTNHFDLPEAPLEGSLAAQVNGAIVSGITWDGANRKVVFPANPAEGSTIIVSYKDAKPLVDTFLIAQDADPRYINVKVNGQSIGANAFTYDAKTGAIKLNTPPPEGQTVIVEWRGSKRAT